MDLFGVQVAMGALFIGVAALARGARPGRPSVSVLLPLFGTLASLVLLSESRGSAQLVGGAFVAAAGLAATNAPAEPTADCAA